MEYYGFAGKIGFVDLTSGKIIEEALDLDVAEKFIGGWGINYKLFLDNVNPGVDPLSSDNAIIIGVGPFVGTLTPAAGKCVVTMKFPAPGSQREEKYVVATAVGGTRRFGAMIKNAGYDHIVITGTAPKPSYLRIGDDGIEICDASDLWGKKDIYETTNELANRHKGNTGLAGVWAIGRGGENQVIGAHAIVDSHNSLGRWGGGAVLGSKKLKAVVSLGSKGVRVADPIRFMALATHKRQEIIKHPKWQAGFPHGQSHKGKQGLFGAPSKEFPPDLFEKTRIGLRACMSCVDACKYVHVVLEGPFKGTVYQTGHWIVLLDFARRLKVKNSGEMMKLMDKMNREGLDHMGTARLMRFVTKMYERGIVTKKDTGGLELKAGDFAAYSALLEKFVKREDIGEYMAEGWYRLSEKVGVDAREDADGASIVKGYDTISDPRFTLLSPTHGISHLTRPRAQHLHSYTYFPFSGNTEKESSWPEYRRSLQDLRQDALKIGMSKEDVERIFTEEDFNMSKFEKHAEDAHGIYNSLGICDSGSHWAWEPMRDTALLSEFYEAVTGIKSYPSEFKKKGERVWAMEKISNVREGWTREDDEIPPQWVKNIETPLKLRTGESYLKDWFGRQIKKEDLENILPDYYEEQGWDQKTGVPTKTKMIKLGLEEYMGIIEMGQTKGKEFLSKKGGGE